MSPRMPYPFQPDLRASLADHLSAFEAETVDDPDLRNAAVAIVVTPRPDSGAASVLLTLRPATMRRHSNQFALPGGRLDDGETVFDAALRELSEELRLDLGADNVLGRLDDYPTRSGFRITPVVVWADHDGPIDHDPHEVAQVFHVPFEDLTGPGMPMLSEPNTDGRRVLSTWLPAIGYHVFSPTAAMLYQFREVAILGNQTRVAHYDQPEFAWK